MLEFELRVTDPPVQNVVGPLAVTPLVGAAFTVTMVGDEVPAHPVVGVTVTIYEPAEVAVIVLVVAPFDHK